NGAALIGLKGLVVKSHGGADAYAFEQALHRAYEAASHGVVERIERIIERIAALHLKPPSDAAPPAPAAPRHVAAA
ncbi:MAG: phosphate acyltransferase, partial [Betaproteobacteria bacterium]|nr:phosphate acyltransferase [Betaproteobacteria bacterium]